MTLDPPSAARPSRGPLGFARAGLGVLFGHGLTLALVVIIGALGALLGVTAVVVPAVAAGAIFPAADLANPDVRWLAAGLTAVLAVLAVPFFVVWLAGGAGAVIAAIGAAITDQPKGAAAAYGAGLQRALPLLGAAVVTQVIRLVAWLPGYFVLLAAGFFVALGARDANPRLQLLAVPFAIAFPIILAALVHVHLRLSFTPFAVVHEDLGPIGAVERSWALTRGRTLRLAGTGAVVVLALAALFAGAVAAARGLGLTPDVANGMIADAGIRLAAALGQAPEAGYTAAVGLAMGINAAVLAGLLGVGLWVVSVWSALYWDARSRDARGDTGDGAGAADRGTTAGVPAPVLAAAPAVPATTGPAALDAPDAALNGDAIEAPPASAAHPPDADELARMREIDLAWSYVQPPESPEPPVEAPPWSALPIAAQSAEDAFAPDWDAPAGETAWTPIDDDLPPPGAASWTMDEPGWAPLEPVDVDAAVGSEADGLDGDGDAGARADSPEVGADIDDAGWGDDAVWEHAAEDVDVRAAGDAEPPAESDRLEDDGAPSTGALAS